MPEVRTPTHEFGSGSAIQPLARMKGTVREETKRVGPSFVP